MAFLVEIVGAEASRDPGPCVRVKEDDAQHRPLRFKTLRRNLTRDPIGARGHLAVALLRGRRAGVELLGKAWGRPVDAPEPDDGRRAAVQIRSKAAGDGGIRSRAVTTRRLRPRPAPRGRP